MWRRACQSACRRSARQGDQQLEHDEQHDGHLEQHQASIARHIQHQLQRLLHAAQLELQRLVSVAEVELGAQLGVDAIHGRVVPGGVGLVQQVQHRQHLAAGAHRRADEPVQAPGAQRHRPLPLQPVDQRVGVHEHLLDDPFVVLHGHALADGQRHDTGARRGHAIHHQHTVHELGDRSRVGAYRELLADYLRLGELGLRGAESGQLGFARCGGHVLKDHRAERVHEHGAAAGRRVAQLVRRAPRLRHRAGDLLERDVLDERDREERMHRAALLIVAHDRAA
jgi:hypothetical protein